MQRPIDVACIGVPVERPLWTDGPSWVLVAEYVPMVTAPGDVVDIILDAARDI